MVAVVLSGDRDAFAGLVRRHQDAVFRLCAGMLGGSGEAEEAAQEAFLKAYKSLGGFRRDSSFSTWLHRIAANHCLDLLRRRSREKTESWEGLLEREGTRLEALASEPGPAAGAEASDLLNRLLALLPEEQRLALLLREGQGLSYDEIASALGWSVDSVKARLRRARRTLEESLRHFSGRGGV